MNRYEFNAPIDDMGVTVVENAFINHFMPKARGEFVKIYLYGLKCCNSGKGMSDTEIAEVLGLNESDVAKAWKYWESEGIVLLDNEEDSCYIQFLSIPPMLFIPGMTAQKKIKKTTSRKYTEMFKDIENKLGRLLAHNEQEIILDWIDKYKFSIQTVVLLIEDCIKRDKRIINYWDSMADIYHDLGIQTYDQLQDYIQKREATNKRNKDILNYLGIYASPTTPQREMMDKWFNEYGFDMDIIKKACDETLKITKPNFAYIDKILTAWHEGKDTPNPPKSATKNYKSGKTRLEDEHDYDVEMLERALFGDE